MAQSAADFFGSFAGDQKNKEPPKSAADFFGQVADEGEAEAKKPAAQAKKPSFRDYWRAEMDLAGKMFPIATPIAENVASLASGAVATPAAGIAGLGATATTGAGLTDAAPADVVGNVQNLLTYSPQTEMGQLLNRVVTAPGELLARGADIAGEGIALPSNPDMPAMIRPLPGHRAITRAEAGDQGSPFLGALVNTAIQASPMLLGIRGRSVAPGESPMARVGPEAPAESMSLDASPATPIRRPDLAMEDTVPRPPPSDVGGATAESAAMPSRAAGSAEALNMPGERAPARPLTAEGAARQTPYTKLEGEAPPKFVEETPVAHQGRELPLDQQQKRLAILERIGLSGPGLRKSAVTGDAKAAATDYQTSKLDTDGGNHLRQLLDNERAAITGYSERLLNDTGGTPGLGQTETLQRGQNIIAPLDDLKAHFDDGIRSLYKAADERAGDMPIQTPKTRELLADESEFLGTVEGESLLKGVRARMKALGMTDAEGNVQATTVKQAERMKQYLGDQWTPRTSRLIRRLKDSIDDDVTMAAGEDIYQAARALRAQRARILDDPKGIARIMDAEGPSNINRAVAVERIPDTITTLPVAQFEHIVRTLRGVPEELRPQAQAALAEIKSQFASKIHEAGSKTAGQWNAPAVTKYLNANSARMKALFTPQELENFATLNDAGHVLRFDASYPGAAVQGHNLARTGVMHALEHGTTAAGASAGSLLGPAGTALGTLGGRALGTKAAEALADRASLKAAQKRTMKLSDVLKLKEQPPPPKERK